MTTLGSNNDWGDVRILHPMEVCLAFSSLTIRMTQQTFLVVCFANMGMRRVAYDGLLALDAAKAYLPDVILLDLGMPELDGIHLARFIREDENLKDKVLIAITGYADEMHRSQCKAAGVDYVFQKPVVWKDIKSTVDRLWSARKMGTK